jgi:hypothetical protein
MLWDDRRGCLQDRIARTFVLHPLALAPIVGGSRIPPEQP